MASQMESFPQKQAEITFLLVHSPLGSCHLNIPYCMLLLE